MFVLLGVWILKLALICSGLEVRPKVNGEVETYISAVKLEGLPYTKRAVNISVSVTVKYEITGVKDPSTVTLSWQRNGEEISVSRRKTDDAPILSGDYSSETFSDTTHTLEVTLHLNQKVPGNYTLIATMDGVTSSGSGFAYSAPVFPLFTKPKRVLEGDIMRLICRVSSYPQPSSVIWSFASIQASQMDDDNAISAAFYNLLPLLTNETHYVLETSDGGTLNDTLRFLDLKESDNGLYACNVSTERGSDFALMIVNVKDRWAALWPFIGIIVEVTILVVAILLYERHQMHSKPTNLSAKCDTTSGAGAVSGQDNVSTVPNNKIQANNNNTGQNNLTVPVHAGDVNTENLDGNVEGRDQKVDEIRLRAHVK
ncbi:basigin related [Schistosoma mansoni]|uniref:basigin related n=1 Tax=Schistosoma mansoni TaxID=6183 RepID=UPI0001A64688|nr:basigin related [Schistosoma mansoni]|eukprot:XP_018650434.1 basigin related [Schistosoma mansoni]